MKRIIITVLAMVYLCFATVSFAGDVPLTNEQALTIQIEKLSNVIEYTEGQIEGLKSQFDALNTVHQRATNHRNAFQKTLDKLRAEKNGG